MKYAVVILTRAKLELYQHALWWAEHRDVDQAKRWLADFSAAINQLADNPQRHAVARENEEFEFTLRSLNFGLGKNITHRALFRVRDDRVIVYTVRHVAQDDVTPDELT